MRASMLLLNKWSGIVFFASICLISGQFSERDRRHLVGEMGIVGDTKCIKEHNTPEYREIMELALERVQSKHRNIHDTLTHNIIVFESQELKYRDLFYDHRYNTHKFVTVPNLSLGKSFYLSLELNTTEQEGLFFRSQHQLSFFKSHSRVHLIKHTYQEHLGTSQPVGVMIEDDSLNIEKMIGTIKNEDKHKDSFKLLTYNIWNLNDPWDKRLEILVDQIKRISPDIIGFQEVRFTYKRTERKKMLESLHQIEQLATLLPEYQFVYQPAMTYFKVQDPLDHTDEGLAIFSKFPILEVDYLKMSRNFSDREDEHQRGCIRALVNTSIGMVNVFSTHFSLSENARRRNGVELLNFMNNFEMPQILVGDFNAEPNSEIVNYLLGNIELNGSSGNFKDAWLETHGDTKESDGWTYTTLEEKPKKRIDFIMYRGNNLHPQSISVVHNDPGKQQPSDHRGLESIFTLENAKNIVIDT